MTTPQSLTVTVTPWGGTYGDRQNNANDGTVSFYGPKASGKFRAKPRADAWEQEWDIPTLHITVDPAAPAQNLHVSLEMGGTGGIKNAHRHWNGGAPSWDLGALDSQKQNWLAAVNAKYPGAVDQVLAEVVNQITTGVAPTYTPPTASTAQQATFTSDDFPALPSQQPTVAAVAAVVEQEQQQFATQDAYAAPSYDESAYDPSAYDQSAYAQPSYGQADLSASSDYDPNAPSANDPVFVPTEQAQNWGAVGTTPIGTAAYDPNAPSANDPVYVPTGQGRPLGAVGEEVPVVAYLDEQLGTNGEEEEFCNFALSDGRSMGVDRATLEAAIAGQASVPWAAPWVSVYWNQDYITVPEAIFTQT